MSADLDLGPPELIRPIDLRLPKKTGQISALHANLGGKDFGDAEQCRAKIREMRESERGERGDRGERGRELTMPSATALSMYFSCEKQLKKRHWKSSP